MLSKTGFTHSDLLRWQIDYAGWSLNVNGTIMRDTYNFMMHLYDEFQRNHPPRMPFSIRDKIRKLDDDIDSGMRGFMSGNNCRLRLRSFFYWYSSIVFSHVFSVIAKQHFGPLCPICPANQNSFAPGWYVWWRAYARSDTGLCNEYQP